ncbi:MAG: hypothetical protein QF809_03650 [Candidatus Peribacteraceae bacterium]|jgi:hypothetical protein|nr:hypothetical protein [Candidatus Peribacteraceae bacterium]MDP7646038.1 hypothetical protein [Candidatus Peribacteraceae bacterium]
MDQYSKFVFDSFAFDQDEAYLEFRYSLDGEIPFLESLSLPGGMEFQQTPLALIDRSLFALHMIAGTSYYKSYCPKQMEIRSGLITNKHADFWNKVYENGLMEFFYKNKLNPEGVINFPTTTENDYLEPLERPFTPGKVLVPIGGGKDSIVTIEILRKAGFDITLMRLGSHPLIDALVEELNLPCLTVDRSLSEKLFELNNLGAMNGHVPITAYISFLNVFMALIYGFESIVMSNERSADEGNLQQWGRNVNHQWSKSWQCEQLLSAYIEHFITPDIKYFSLLRHLSELGIVRYFSKLPQYFSKVTSCNKNWKILQERSESRWCCECSKCASTFALFAAYIPKDQMVEMFGQNIFEDHTQGILYRQILGLAGNKPFECVGTIDEMRAAFMLAHERGDFDDTPVMQMFLKEVLPQIKDPDKLKKKEISPASEHGIPEEFLTALHAPEGS